MGISEITTAILRSRGYSDRPMYSLCKLNFTRKVFATTTTVSVECSRLINRSNNFCFSLRQTLRLYDISQYQTRMTESYLSQILHYFYLILSVFCLYFICNQYYLHAKETYRPKTNFARSCKQSFD